MQRSALCRSRRELSKEYLLAKIRVDTAENEPLEVWGKIIQNIQYYSIVSLGRRRAPLQLRQRRGRSLQSPARDAVVEQRHRCWGFQRRHARAGQEESGDQKQVRSVSVRRRDDRQQFAGLPLVRVRIYEQDAVDVPGTELEDGATGLLFEGLHLSRPGLPD